MSAFADFHPATPDELKTVARLKERFFAQISEPSKLMTKSDAVFLRFLRGQKHDEDRALEYLLQHQKWRVEQKVDDTMELCKHSREVFEGSGTCTLLYDKSKRPASYTFARKHSTKDRVLEDCIMFNKFLFERMLIEGDPEEQRGIIVMDLSGFGLANMDYEYTHRLFSMIEAHYPEVLHRYLIVNAPFIFSACWPIIRPWIDPSTAEKVEFIKHDQLSNYFNLEHIPK